MNSEKETTSTSQVKTNSSNSLQIVVLSKEDQTAPTVNKLQSPAPSTNSSSPQPAVEMTNDELDAEFMAAPLVGLLPKGQQLTEQERRDHVIFLRNLRQSFQTYKATIESEAKDKPSKKGGKPQETAADVLNDIL